MLKQSMFNDDLVLLFNVKLNMLNYIYGEMHKVINYLATLSLFNAFPICK